MKNYAKIFVTPIYHDHNTLQIKIAKHEAKLSEIAEVNIGEARMGAGRRDAKFITMTAILHLPKGQPKRIRANSKIKLRTKV